MAEDATLLHFFFTFSGDQEEQFLVFSLLVPYLYDCGDVGQLARDALLLVLSVSRKLKCVAAFIASKVGILYFSFNWFFLLVLLFLLDFF